MADEAKNGKEGITDPKTGIETPKEVVMTQEALDTLINKKFGQGGEKAKVALLDKLGVENVEQLQALLDANKKAVKDKAEAEEASKSEVQKTNDAIAKLTDEVTKLTSQNKKQAIDMAIGKFASENNIKDVDYFKHLHVIAMKEEDFDEATFMKTIKKDKPYLFDDNSADPKIDGSPNKTPPDLSKKISSATTMAELYALQSEALET